MTAVISTWSRIRGTTGVVVSAIALMALTTQPAAAQDDDPTSRLSITVLVKPQVAYPGSSVRVSGNWRITFVFAGTDADLVDYEDYH